jgi:catechol 2,3-dioxygenase-like lactoylglutathione lyase family enzyme
MIGHIGFYVNNLNESKTFYTPLLKVLGYEMIFENEACLCLGREGIAPHFTNPYCF